MTGLGEFSIFLRVEVHDSLCLETPRISSEVSPIVFPGLDGLHTLSGMLQTVDHDWEYSKV